MTGRGVRRHTGWIGLLTCILSLLDLTAGKLGTGTLLPGSYTCMNSVYLPKDQTVVPTSISDT